MRLADLLAHLDPVQVSGPVDRPIQRVTHDSRLAGKEDIFVAIVGARSDGRTYARTLEVAAVIADQPVDVLPGVTVILVEDARRALALASAAVAGFPGRAMKVIGITGTNGKTTTSWMVEAIARHAGERIGVIGTTGARIAGAPEPLGFTTPEAPVLQDLLARMRAAGCGLVVMEVSSIGLSLYRADGIPFRVAVFTSFTQDHLDFHHTMDAYAAAKARLFQDLLASDGTAVLNMDDPSWARFQPSHGLCWTYGLSPSAELRAEIRACDLSGTRALVRWRREEGELVVRLPGPHNVSNALAAVASGLAVGIPLQTCLEGIAALTRVPGRLDPVENDRGLSIFVDYAHTPDALERVLDVLRPLTPGRLITVFGCGGDRDRGKRPLMGRAASERSDLSILTSDNPRSEEPGAILADILAGVVGAHEVEPDRAAAIARAVRLARPGDCVLIAGKGHETTQTIGALTLPFDDAEVARAALEALP